MRRKNIFRPPPRPPLADTLYTTQHSLNRKYEYLSFLETRLDAARTDKKISHAEGDLRENFGFKAAKQDIARLSRQLEDLQKLFACHNFEPVNPLDWPDQQPETVCLGAEVTIQRASSPTPDSYIVCGFFDADFSPDDLDENKAAQLDHLMSYTSPLMRQLLGHTQGDNVPIMLHGMQDTIRITEVKAPTLERIMEVYGVSLGPSPSGEYDIGPSV